MPARLPAVQTLSDCRARLALLTAADLSDIPTKLAGAAPDDVLDALAACWSAERIHLGTAETLPIGSAPVDARGLRMEIRR
jgi:predicted RNase H-like nuclease